MRTTLGPTRCCIRPAVGPAVLLALSLSSGCGESPTSPSPSFHVEVTDPAGDAPVTQAAPNPPDLVHLRVDVQAGTATFALRFAPGWDLSTTFLDVFLDIDQNSATGVPGDGMGAEYDLGPGAVLKFVGTTTTVVGSPTFTSVSDGMN